jgi:hypothetical protein
MPSRLVQVRIENNKYTLRLVQGMQHQKYLALSHCWGRNMKPSAKTMTSTLQDYMVDISWANLTQTFRDAVALTERLGYSYIWIDSLCIIQDDNADWEAEATKMGSIYQNCDLMLSADAAADGTTGFFRPAQISSRPWKPQSPSPVFAAVNVAYIKTHRTFGQMAQMFASREEFEYVSPLDSRAWCYQERRLAPRIAHFGIDELHWDCTAESTCQCGAYGPEGILQFGGEPRKLLRALIDAGCTMMEKHTHWLLTVTQYSERELTFWTDRLPALSGLVRLLLPAAGSNSTVTSTTTTAAQRADFYQTDLGRYLAGHWYNCLNRDLCWFAHYTPGKRVSSAAQYVAPSWSWASVSGTVSWPPEADFEPLAEIVSAASTPSGVDSMGRVCYGEVILRAKLIQLAAYRGISTTTDGTQRVFDHLECPTRRASPGTYRPDAVPDGIPGGLEFFAGSNHFMNKPDVRGADLQPLTDGEYYGLLMAKTYVMVVRPVAGKGQDTYERLGCMDREGLGGQTRDKSSFFRGVASCLVKLV